MSHGHVYVSASSQDNRDTSRQRHTVALTPEAIAALDLVLPTNTCQPTPEPADEPGGKTTAIARVSVYQTPPPRVMTVADVDRELAKTSADDPPTFVGVVADMGYPTGELPTVEDSDGEQTTAWEVDTRA